MCMAAQWSRPITHSHWRVVNISWVQCCCCTQSAVFCSSSSLYTFSSCTVTGCLYFSFFFFFQLFCFCGARLSFLSSREVKLCFWCRTVWLAQEGIPTERVSFFFFFLPISLKKNSSNHVGQVFHSPKSFFFFFFVHTHYVYLWLRKNTGWLFARFGSHSRYYLHKGAVVLLVVRELWKKKMSCSFFICSSIEFF